MFFGTLADIDGHWRTWTDINAQDLDTTFSAHNDHGSMKHEQSLTQSTDTGYRDHVTIY